jgi:hypothetical protein
VAGRLMAQPVYPQFQKYSCVPALTLRANNGLCAVSNRQGTMIVASHQESRSRQPRSSTASMMRSRLFHQTRGAMLFMACNTGLVINQSADKR